MSLQLLQKSIDYIDTEDGIATNKKKKMTKRRKTDIAEEREVVRNLDDRFQFDVESAQLIKKKRNEVHKRDGDLSNFFSQSEARDGYSLIEQFRDTKPLDVTRHNQQYLATMQKLNASKHTVGLFTRPIVKRNARRKRQLGERDNVKFALYEPAKKQAIAKKTQTKSVFSEKDFANLPTNFNGNLTRKVRKLK